MDLNTVDSVVFTGGPIPPSLAKAVVDAGFTSEAHSFEPNVVGLQRLPLAALCDPKEDSDLKRKLTQLLRRSQLYVDECERRGVRFLPVQVMRPVFAVDGVANGKYRRNLEDRFSALFAST